MTASRGAFIVLASALFACGALLGIQSDDDENPPTPSADAAMGDAASTTDALPGDGGAESSCALAAASLASDKNNCGACGHDCLGGNCVGGMCQPERIAMLSPSGVADRFILHGDHIYVRFSYNGLIHLFDVTISTRAIADLEPTSASPEFAYGDIVADDTAVYWGTNDGIHVHTIDAGTDGSWGEIIRILDIGAVVRGLRFGSPGSLQWTRSLSRQDNGGVYTCTLPNCLDLQLLERTNYAVDLLVVAGRSFELEQPILDAGALELHENADVPLTNDPNPSPYASRLVTDGTRIYWSTPHNLRMFTVAKNTAINLFPTSTTDLNRAFGIAIHPIDQSLYFGQQSHVKRCVVTDIATSCVSEDVATVDGVVVKDVAFDTNATFVYFLDGSGGVWRKRL